MAPHLSLAYSSQAGTYGSPIAANWSLSIPDITEDTSQGRLRTHAPEIEAAQGALAALDDRFASSMAGGRSLVRVTEPAPADVIATYRAQNDTTFARYQRLTATSAYRWRVLVTDGSTMKFGESSRTTGCANVSDGYAPLTSVADAFGNEVAYEYESAVTGECRIKRIYWGQNTNAGVTQPFAQVTFTWQVAQQCSGIEIGSQQSYRTGKLVVTGASKLSSIVASAFPLGGSPVSPDHQRTISLGYNATTEDCTANFAPYRQLTSITESASGQNMPAVTLPPVTFTYNPVSIQLTQTRASSVLWGNTDQYRNLAWGYRYNDERWPTVEAMLLDVDGDGLLDRVENAFDGSSCKAAWKRNLGAPAGSSTPQFETTARTINLPRLKWSSPPPATPYGGPSATGTEHCSLDGQATLYSNSRSAAPGTFCHDPSSPTCTASGDPTDTTLYCAGGTECAGYGHDGVPFLTYLAYRWMDMDNDGLVDLVTAVHGNINVFDIGGGNAFPNESYSGAEPYNWPDCPQVDRCVALDTTCLDSGAQARTCPSGQSCTYDWQKINSCGKARRGCDAMMAYSETDQLAPPGNGSPTAVRRPYTRCQGLYPWMIYKNQGNGSFATTPTIKYQPCRSSPTRVTRAWAARVSRPRTTR